MSFLLSSAPFLGSFRPWVMYSTDFLNLVIFLQQWAASFLSSGANTRTRKRGKSGVQDHEWLDSERAIQVVEAIAKTQVRLFSGVGMERLARSTRHGIRDSLLSALLAGCLHHQSSVVGSKGPTRTGSTSCQFLLFGAADEGVSHLAVMYVSAACQCVNEYALFNWERGCGCGCGCLVTICISFFPVARTCSSGWQRHGL